MKIFTFYNKLYVYLFKVFEASLRFTANVLNFHGALSLFDQPARMCGIFLVNSEHL